MTRDLTVWDRYFRYSLIGAAVTLGALDAFSDGNDLLYKSFFVITVGGLVGYFTNFLAIKMLFQPKRGKVLGWSGLVPRNQAQIARSLGESVQEQLLSPQIILAYIRDRQLIDVGRRQLSAWVDEKIQKPTVRRRIAELLVERLSAHGPTLLTNGFDLVEAALQRMAQNPELIADYWQKLRVELVAHMADQHNRGKIAEQTRRVMQKQLPEVAFWLNRALEDYLSNKHTVGSLGKGLKRLVSFDQDAILDLLQRFYEDPDMADEFMGILDAVMDGIQRELTTDETQTIVLTQLEQWVAKLAEVSRRTVLPSAIEQFDAYLQDEANWAQIEEGVVGAIRWLSERAGRLLESEEGRAYLSAGIENAVQRLNVTELVEEQVMQLDTDELEKMVLDNTGGNLTVIQMLGGMLGMVIGTVQVHILFVLPIAGLMGVVWMAWNANERRQAERLS